MSWIVVEGATLSALQDRVSICLIFNGSVSDAS